MKNSSAVWIILAVFLVVVGSIAADRYFFGKPESLSTTGTANVPGTAAPAGQGAVQCAQNPTIGSTGIDAIVTGTSVTPGTLSYIVNNKPVGNSYTAVLGDKVTALASPTGYLPEFATLNSVPCGTYNLPFSFKKYANATATLYTDAGTAILTNAAAGGAVNETQMTSAKNWKLHLVGVTQQSTSKIFWVTEMPSGSSSNVSTVTMSCNGQALPPATIPSYVSSSNTNSFRTAWEIPALDNGAVQDCYISASVLGGKTLQGSIYNTAYAEANFINDDGTQGFGIYSQLGTAKYKDSYSYNFRMG